MRVRYWGVRGSVPTPGPTTVRTGGNTSCASVEVAGGVLVLDAGTGIRALGAALAADARDVFLLLTHRHADHVQGLPFFAPLVRAGGPVFLLDLEDAQGCWSPLELFDGIHTPMRPEWLAPTVTRVQGDALQWLAARGIRVARLPLCHPGGCYGYRIEEGGRSYVHMTDTELTESGGDDFFRSCVDFCRGAELLCHDAQYLAREMETLRGRGHSSVERACDLARAAGVGRLVLFHHDPARTDAEVDEVERAARRRLASAGVACDAAREGLEIEL